MGLLWNSHNQKQNRNRRTRSDKHQQTLNLRKLLTVEIPSIALNAERLLRFISELMIGAKMKRMNGVGSERLTAIVSVQALLFFDLQRWALNYSSRYRRLLNFLKHTFNTVK